MNRETKSKITLLKKTMASVSKQLIKPYGYKQIDGLVWTIQNEFIFVLFPFITSLDDKPELKITCSVKPLFADDILWDIMGMESNKNEPLSLRVKGAFAVFGVEFYKKKYPLEKLDVEELPSYLEDSLKWFYTLLTTKNGNEKIWFNEVESSNPTYYHCDIMRLMIMIKAEQFNNAIGYLDSHNVRGFTVGDKNIDYMIRDYCKKRL